MGQIHISCLSGRGDAVQRLDDEPGLNISCCSARDGHHLHRADEPYNVSYDGFEELIQAERYAAEKQVIERLRAERLAAEKLALERHGGSWSRGSSYVGGEDAMCVGEPLHTNGSASTCMWTSSNLPTAAAGTMSGLEDLQRAERERKPASHSSWGQEFEHNWGHKGLDSAVSTVSRDLSRASSSGRLDGEEQSLKDENQHLCNANEALQQENRKLRRTLQELDCQKAWRMFDVVEHHYKQLERHRQRMADSNDEVGSEMAVTESGSEAHAGDASPRLDDITSPKRRGSIERTPRLPLTPPNRSTPMTPTEPNGPRPRDCGSASWEAPAQQRQPSWNLRVQPGSVQPGTTDSRSSSMSPLAATTPPTARRPTLWSMGTDDLQAEDTEELWVPPVEIEGHLNLESLEAVPSSHQKRRLSRSLLSSNFS